MLSCRAKPHSQGTMVRYHMNELNGEPIMPAKETSGQREKKELDRQLDEELEGTFPASDPLKITRFSAKSRSAADRKQKDASARKKDS
jgi:hypothetical protein